jgi:hypothetical protein
VVDAVPQNFQAPFHSPAAAQLPGLDRVVLQPDELAGVRRVPESALMRGPQVAEGMWESLCFLEALEPMLVIAQQPSRRVDPQTAVLPVFRQGIDGIVAGHLRRVARIKNLEPHAV